MNINKIRNELSLHRIIIVFISLVFIGFFSLKIPSGSSETDILKIEEHQIEEIEIVQIPFVAKVQDKISIIETELPRGSNLNSLLISNGISREDASSVVFEMSSYVNLRSMQAGELFDLKYINNTFYGISMLKSNTTIVEVYRDTTTESGFRGIEKERKLSTYIKQVSGSINGSLYNSAISEGISTNILMELIMLLSFDVDFQRDIQEGDSFNVVFESVYDEEGNKVEDGNILFAELITGGREIEFFRYTDLSGSTDYFNNKGDTIRKTLLKTPINGAYLTSGYGMRRSPITGYSKKHYGLDFGAPSGTPIYASGDGVVIAAYYSAVYGNFIQIRHTNGYKTLYAHMTNYAGGIRRGSRVNQGQVIGYVGSTGMSTGPHLHYEVSYYDTRVNPNSVKCPPGRSLDGEDMVLFNNLKKSFIASFL